MSNGRAAGSLRNFSPSQADSRAARKQLNGRRLAERRAPSFSLRPICCCVPARGPQTKAEERTWRRCGACASPEACADPRWRRVSAEHSRPRSSASNGPRHSLPGRKQASSGPPTEVHFPQQGLLLVGLSLQCVPEPPSPLPPLQLLFYKDPILFLGLVQQRPWAFPGRTARLA